METLRNSWEEALKTAKLYNHFFSHSTNSYCASCVLQYKRHWGAGAACFLSLSLLALGVGMLQVMMGVLERIMSVGQFSLSLGTQGLTSNETSDWDLLHCGQRKPGNTKEA